MRKLLLSLPLLIIGAMSCSSDETFEELQRDKEENVLDILDEESDMGKARETEGKTALGVIRRN
jgi:hypothetical protein